jgi:hypothetical protein
MLILLKATSAITKELLKAVSTHINIARKPLETLRRDLLIMSIKGKSPVIWALAGFLNPFLIALATV